MPDLMRPGHREIEHAAAVHVGDVPRAVQFRLLAVDPLARPRGQVGLRAVAGEGRHGLRLQVHGAEGVVFGVGDVEDVAHQRHALGTVEFGLLERAVGQARSAVADQNGMLTIEIGHHVTVVAGIGDEQAIRFGVGQHLAGIEQGGVVGLLVFREELDGREVQLAFELGDRSGHELVEHFEGDFAGILRERHAVGTKHHERRPALDAEVVPDDLIRVTDDGMLDAVLADFLADVIRRRARR